MKRKKSTGGLFLGTHQFSMEELPFVMVSVTDVGVLVVLGTECIFFGLPTVKGASTRGKLISVENVRSNKQTMINCGSKGFSET